ncbi:MAG: sialidase family protein [Planctomycetota bacterium]
MNEGLAYEEHDISKYPAGLTGWGGCDLNEHVARWELLPAFRRRLGKPGETRGLYKAGTTMLPNGDIVCVPCVHPRGGEKRFAARVFRSSDKGTTWEEIGRTPLFGKEPGLTCLRNGVLILTTEDLSGETTPICRSEDGGATWTSVDLGERRGTVRNVLEEDDGSVTMFKGAKYQHEHYDQEVWIYKSADEGRTWKVSGKTVWKVEPAATPEEPHVIRLPDRRLLGVVRVGGTHIIRGTQAPPGFEAGDHLLLTELKDGGRTWTPCRDFLGYAKVHGWLTLLADGRLLCSYSSYHHPFGVFAVLSKDLGKTWDMLHPIELAISADVYVGWPVSVELAPGEILTSYATTVYPKFRDGDNSNMTTSEIVRWSVPEG